MAVTPDEIAALVAFLKADADVAAAVGEHIYGERLPDSMISGNTPIVQPAVVLSSAAGSADFKYMNLNTLRVDVRCYAATPYDAKDIHRRVHPALKGLVQHVEGTTLIHRVDPEISPFQALDPDTSWPVVFSSWQVLAAEVATP